MPRQIRLEVPIQVLFIVPKKKFKRAHDRNRIKRQLREAWRLNAHLLRERLEQSASLPISIAFFYLKTEHETSENITKSMKTLLSKAIHPIVS